VEANLNYVTTVEENEPQWPICTLVIDEEAYNMTGSDLSEKLRNGDPSIEASYRVADKQLIINPKFLLEGDEVLITDRIKKILS
jgi:hypothetical protein